MQGSDVFLALVEIGGEMLANVFGHVVDHALHVLVGGLVEDLFAAPFRPQHARRAQQPQMMLTSGCERPCFAAISETHIGALRHDAMIFNRLGSPISRNISASSTTWSSLNSKGCIHAPLRSHQ